MPEIDEWKKQKIKEMWDNGRMINEIAKKLGVHRNTVRKYACGWHGNGVNME